MNVVILKSSSKNKLKLLMDVAKEFGVKANILTDEELEDMGLAQAIKQDRTGEYVDTEEFLTSLRKK